MRRTSIYTIAALVILRLVIGGHFLSEGWYKIRLTLVGESESTKPFSSEAYLREGNGPLAPYVHPYLHDADETAKDRLKARPIPPDGNYAECVPVVIAAEWDALPGQLADTYDLDDKQKADIKDIVNLQKLQLGFWLVADRSMLTGPTVANPGFLDQLFRLALVNGNVVAPLKIYKRPFPSGKLDEPMTTPERLAYYNGLFDELDEYKNKRGLAVGKPVDKAQTARIRADIVDIRQDLLADLDKFTTSLKDELARVVKRPLTEFSLWDKKEDRAKQLESLLTQKDAPLPAPIATKVDEYVALFVKTYRLNDEQKTAAGGQADRYRETLRHWLASEKLKNQVAAYQKMVAEHGQREEAYRQQRENQLLGRLGLFTAGQPVLGSMIPEAPLAAKPADEEKAAYQDLVQTSDSQTAALKKALDVVLEGPKAKGYPPEPAKPTSLLARAKAMRFIDWVDMITMVVIAAVGFGLVFGLFTRISCFFALCFLVMTYLTYPPFPWLPTPPNTEGNPVYVNKNVIEFAALLVLLTVPSGRWFGLDALVAWLFQRRKRPATVSPHAATSTNGHHSATEADSHKIYR